MSSEGTQAGRKRVERVERKFSSPPRRVNEKPTDPHQCPSPNRLVSTPTVGSALPWRPPIESVMPSNHLILCHPLLLQPSIFPSIRVFSNESVLRIRSPKYWSFSFSISPSNEYSGLISFQIDWLNLPAIQGTLKSFLQYHSSKA